MTHVAAMPSKTRAPRGVYVAVSGNTGSGKSTVLRAIGQALDRAGIDAEILDERALHSPHVPKMFESPKSFALGVQLSFLVNRFLAITDALHRGVTLVMERSHLDDELFIRHHRQSGHVTASQIRAYRGLAAELHSLIPNPSLLVLTSASPAVSLARIRRDEQSGARPVEFPDASTKSHFVHAWARHYREFHARVRRSSIQHLIHSSRTPPQLTAERVAAVVRHLRSSLND